jgi:hypothetical protein
MKHESRRSQNRGTWSRDRKGDVNTLRAKTEVVHGRILEPPDFELLACLSDRVVSLFSRSIAITVQTELNLNAAASS